MLKYDIVWAGISEELVKRVNEKLEAGWRPIGRPFAKAKNDFLFQAIVRDMTQKEVDEVLDRDKS